VRSCLIAMLGILGNIMQNKKRSEWLEIAESNGISCSAFDTRIYKYKWTHEKAATTPARARHMESLTNDERKVRNYARVMKCQLAIQSHIDDIVKIIKDKREETKLIKEARKIYRKIAIQNGISYAAFNMRISRGWSLDSAATKPTCE